MTVLVDSRGRPLRREVLTEEIAAPTLAGVRSPISGYPADGMNPVRLANILRAADQGDPLAYFELAEQIEERDLHYLGVLGTRKRQVSQIDVTVIAASDEPDDVELANMVREWLDRDELADEMFDILDAVGKGVSYTEIVWDFSEGQYRPDRLEWRDPRFFTFDPRDGRTPLLRGGEDGRSADAPLAPFKFIEHRLKAKSGLPIRSGIARVAAWAWMFKAFTQRDWAVFAQTYGQPIRLGKFDSTASAADKQTLWRAVANIAGDCAALIPKGMELEFIQAPNLGAASDLYEKRADWLDRQISKGVLGQTGTTDSKQGGLGDGGNKVHERVAEDIETADCKATAATLNRDLVRPWVDLERGPRPRGKYPRIRIARPKQEDLTGLSDGLVKLVPLGLKVQMSEVRDKFGLADPDKDAEVLRAPALPAPIGTVALQSQAPRLAAPADQIADQLVIGAAPTIDQWFGDLQAMMAAATSLPELAMMVRAAYPQLDATRIVASLGDGLAAARAAGMSDVADTGA